MSSPKPKPSPSTPTSTSTNPSTTPLPTASTSLIRPPRYYMLTAFTNRLLPLALFTIFLITGTVILIYTVVDKKVLPMRYIVGSYITVAVIVGLWGELRVILFLRRGFGGLGTDELERGMGMQGVNGVNGGIGINGINGIWGKKERRVKKCLKWLRETGGLIGKFNRRNHGNRNGDGNRSTESESRRNNIEIANSSNPSQVARSIQNPQPAQEEIPLRNLGHPTPDPRVSISPLQIAVPSLSIPMNTQARSSRPRSYPHASEPSRRSQIHAVVSSHKRAWNIRSRDMLSVQHPEQVNALQPVPCIDGESRGMDITTQARLGIELAHD
ncbi:hypothetical protein OCU04_013086 [Sclerotinia nivalis]|uniref:Uncharacterized protein n=1 Tax=Sclerotinia nivalis TaxID=352851 RepID=A0A9X0DCM1_9HELO|nr:hypothetical protein OCU04_013086 [Sclerotinia nivalis]